MNLKRGKREGGKGGEEGGKLELGDSHLATVKTPSLIKALLVLRKLFDTFLSCCHGSMIMGLMIDLLSLVPRPLKRSA